MTKLQLTVSSTYWYAINKPKYRCKVQKLQRAQFYYWLTMKLLMILQLPMVLHTQFLYVIFEFTDDEFCLKLEYATSNL